MKKLLLSLGSVAAIATPVLAVVACGDKDTVNTHGISVKKASTTGFNVLLPEVKGKFKRGAYYIESGAVGTKLKVVKDFDSDRKNFEYTTLEIVNELNNSSKGDSFKIGDMHLVKEDVLSVELITKKCLSFHTKEFLSQ